MKITHCKHCERSCKLRVQADCKDYLPIVGGIERMEKEVRELYKQKEYAKAKEIQEKINKYYYFG